MFNIHVNTFNTFSTYPSPTLAFCRNQNGVIQAITRDDMLHAEHITLEFDTVEGIVLEVHGSHCLTRAFAGWAG